MIPGSKGRRRETDREGGKASRWVLFPNCCGRCQGFDSSGISQNSPRERCDTGLYLSTSSWAHSLRIAPGSCPQNSWLFLYTGLAGCLSFRESSRAADWRDPWLALEVETVWAHTELPTYHSCGCNQGGPRRWHQSTCNRTHINLLHLSFLLLLF